MNNVNLSNNNVTGKILKRINFVYKLLIHYSEYKYQFNNKNRCYYTTIMKSTNINPLKIPLNKGVTNEAIDILMAEGGESFYNYVDCLGLADEPDLIVLSSKHHYYYDPEEMNGFKTVINLKEFNQIKNIKSFLNSFLYYLPQKSNFIGCFTDNEKVNGYELKYRSVQ